MDSFSSIQYKQIESFGLSTESLTGDFVYPEKYPKYDSNGNFILRPNIIDSSELDTVETFSSKAANPPRYNYGAVITPNNFIFLSPESAGGAIGRINLRFDFYFTVGSLTFNANDLASAVLYKDNIYFGPRLGTFILRHNIYTNEQKRIPHGISSPNYIASILAPNGWIYYIPFNGSILFKFHPETETIVSIASISGTNKWGSCVLVGNVIYCIPFTDTRILKINTKDDTITYFGNITGTNKYLSGALALNGCIYAAPENATTVLKVDTTTDTITQFGSLGASASKYRGMTLGLNGMLYSFGSTASTILKINPYTDSITTISGLPAGASTTAPNYYGSVLGLDGKIYGIPMNPTVFHRLKTTNNFNALTNNIDVNYACNRTINKGI